MMLETIIYEKEDEIAWIKFNRPQVLNAENDQLVRDLLSALEEARKDSEVRVVILKGEGRAFCAGADLKERSIPKTMQEKAQHFKDDQDLAHVIKELGKPIIAAVHGYALGAGFEYALACDIRIAAENAQFGLPEASVGAAITTAGLQYLPRLIGMAKAKELAFTSKRIDAQEAYRIGLVNKVVPLEELDKAAMEMAEKILKNYPLAIKLNRAAVSFALSASLEEALVHEAQDDVASHAAGDMDRTRREKRWGRTVREV